MTISSMTGYANVTRETKAGTLTIELKSVNSRFLDLQFRMNDELRALEPGLREIIMARIARGKVECRVSIGQRNTSVASQVINAVTLASLAALQTQVRATFIDALPLTTFEVLRWPGMIEENHLSEQIVRDDVIDAMQEVMAGFLDSRTREGSALQAALESRIDELQALVAKLVPIIPLVVAQFQQNSIQRMQVAFSASCANVENTLNTSLRDEMLDRIRQEVTLYGIRIDVSEELTRLSTHLTETRQILKHGSQVGKRLDFMMQELNREANTVGSKAAVRELADASMSMKLLIEQMREQVQNLE